MAVQATPRAKATPKETTPTDRFERYDAVGPDGETVHIERNIETGETSVL